MGRTNKTERSAKKTRNWRIERGRVEAKTTEQQCYWYSAGRLVDRVRRQPQQQAASSTLGLGFFFWGFGELQQCSGTYQLANVGAGAL